MALMGLICPIGPMGFSVPPKADHQKIQTYQS